MLANNALHGVVRADASGAEARTVFVSVHHNRTLGKTGLCTIEREDKPLRFAVGSFIEEAQNYVEVVQWDSERDEMVAHTAQRLEQPYPATKVLFFPSAATTHADLIATSADGLRLWHLTPEGPKFQRFLDSKVTAVAPLTSFDWASHDTSKIVTCSIDMSCAVWDIEKGALNARLTIHQDAVHDVAWGAANVFGTAAADGSARIVDTRASDQASLVYQTQGSPSPALLRIGWNKQDPRYIAVLAAHSKETLIIDMRRPAQPLALTQHTATVNAFALSPTSPHHICTAGDDQQALIWDLQRNATNGKGLEPALSYRAAAEVVALQWSGLNPNYVAIVFGSQAQVLHV